MTATRSDLVEWVREALLELGGTGTVVQVAKQIWNLHQQELEEAGEPLFFTWQYDIRWAAQKLRDNGVLNVPGSVERGLWSLK